MYGHSTTHRGPGGSGSVATGRNELPDSAEGPGHAERSERDSTRTRHVSRAPSDRTCSRPRREASGTTPTHRPTSRSGKQCTPPGTTGGVSTARTPPLSMTGTRRCGSRPAVTSRLRVRKTSSRLSTLTTARRKSSTRPRSRARPTQRSRASPNWRTAAPKSISPSTSRW